MRILFYLGHPAHFHLLKNTINSLSKSNTIFVLIKKKDVLEELLINSSIPYFNILKDGRKDSFVGIIIGILKKDFGMLKFCIANKPDIMIGTSAEITHVGKLLKIPSFVVNEDDSDVVPNFCKLSYPFATGIISPVSCYNGRWESKSLKYEGYHELAYLHPKNFIPDIQIVKKYISSLDKFVLLRFAKLNAHHDKGIKGIDDEIALKIIDILSANYKIYITSERELSPQLEKYRLSINPLHIHHFLAFSSLYVGDSQTMAAEAGVLGTPFVRYNDFVSRIGYLNELESKYELGYGFKTSELTKMLDKIIELSQITNLKEKWVSKKNRMLKEKINTAAFLTWFIENYPTSLKIMKENPDYQLRFK